MIWGDAAMLRSSHIAGEEYVDNDGCAAISAMTMLIGGQLLGDSAMIRHFCALLIAMLCASSAQAADLGPYGRRDHGSIKDEPLHKPFSWTGFYVGATAGYGWGESRFDDGATSNPFDLDGFVAGGTLGYNYQFHGTWVVGLEADISYSDISGSFGPGNLGQPNGAGWGCGSGPCVTDVNWFGTVRGRVGPTLGPVFFYATGGFAYGEFESAIQNTTTWRTGNTNVGWTAGGGIEYAFAPNWSAKVEYLHVDLGWSDRTPAQNFKSDAEFDIVRAGLNYQFGH